MNRGVREAPPCWRAVDELPSGELVDLTPNVIFAAGMRSVHLTVTTLGLDEAVLLLRGDVVPPLR